MTELSTARDLIAYMLWADRVVLRAAAELAPEDLERDAGTSFGSVLGTLAHVLGAQQLWLARFVGDPLGWLPGIDTYPDLPRLEEGFEEFWADAKSFLAALSAEQLLADLSWTSLEGESHTLSLWQCILHLVNHSTYHRGQVITLFRQLGYEPPSTDLITFLNGRSLAH
ncbi:MAG: DinB family protein [Acidobacteria bacterium]|nr:DinB family protein [Acidobacteriota bacterium]